MKSLFGLLVFMILLMGCHSEVGHPVDAHAGATKAQTAESPFKNPVAASDAEQALVDIPLPKPGEVLNAIYDEPGDGSAAYYVGDMAWGAYWYGHTYELDGQKYFTGFVYCTYPDEGMETPAPGDRVMVAQATYARAMDGAASSWKLLRTQGFLGDFGGRDRGNAIEEGAPAQTFRTASGDYLLAVPAWYLEMGVRAKVAELFMLTRKSLQWKYLGGLETGDDNEVSCASGDDKGLPPCTASTGTLQFRTQPGKNMPLIRVDMKGTDIGSPGKTRKLGPGDEIEYHYDRATSQYVLVQR